MLDGISSDSRGYGVLARREASDDAARREYENAVDDAGLRIAEIATECSARGVINDLISDMQFVALGREIEDETGAFRRLALDELRRVVNEMIGG